MDIIGKREAVLPVHVVREIGLSDKSLQVAIPVAKHMFFNVQVKERKHLRPLDAQVVVAVEIHDRPVAGRSADLADNALHLVRCRAKRQLQNDDVERLDEKPGRTQHVL